jgi:hypothetical protein
MYVKMKWLKKRNFLDLTNKRIFFVITKISARFFAHVRTGPGAHPASCTMGTGSFPGIKRPGRGADHPPPPSVEVMKE